MTDTPKIEESPEEVLSTLSKDGKRRWLYPIVSKGKHYYRRLGLAVALIGLFLALPIVKVGGNPAVFLDVINREFHFFGLTLYPTDTILLMIFLVAVLLSVFLLTAFLGRVWCGWGCPQTIYLEFLYRPIERLIEGRETTRKRRDEGPWTFDKAWRKVLKWSVYLGISLFLAHAFLAYFVSWERLTSWMTLAPSEHWGTFVAMGILTALILFDFGIFREQMCTITCPYARLQSVLQDQDSLIVSYDPNRGEPRGRRTREMRKKEKAGEPIGLGDCIDCGACVRTCPTGIDIRDGLQMECVACTQCIDACNDIMDGIGKPHGLIRYTSEKALEDKETSILRPRTVIYSLILVGLVSAFVAILSSRSTIEVDTLRMRGAPFSQIKDDKVANRLRFRVRNQSGAMRSFTVVPVEPSDLEMKFIGPENIDLAMGEMTGIEVWVVSREDQFTNGELDATFEVRSEDGEVVGQDTFKLLGPVGSGGAQ
ncbi:MAG: cytochrome c oxidase accessory protein CcoG [Myxococcota bacterium]